MKMNLIPIEMMSQRINSFFLDMRAPISKIFSGDEDFFAIFYGSYAYRTASENSDLDLLVVSQKVDIKAVEALKDLVFDAHHKYKMSLDFDIPYETKLVQSLNFMASACSGEGLIEDEKWSIRPFQKERDVLTSEKFLKRFFIAMMANPHIFITGNYSLYQKLRLTATRNLLRALISINKISKINVDQAVKLLCGSGEETGEMFLGFHHSHSCYAYLQEYIGRILHGMGAKTTYVDDQITYDFTNLDLLKSEILEC